MADLSVTYLAIVLLVCLSHIGSDAEETEGFMVPLKYLGQTQCIPDEGSKDAVILGEKEYGIGGNFLILASLGILLKPFEHHQCFVGIDNFRHVDLLEPTVPVVIRKPVLAVLCEKFKPFRVFNSYTWVDDNLIIYNVSTGVEMSFYDLSEKLTTYESLEASLIQRYPVYKPIDLVGFIAPKSKPWSCQIHFQILSFTKTIYSLFNLFSHPPLFWFPHVPPFIPTCFPVPTFPFLDKTLPSTIPKIKILVCSIDSVTCRSDHSFSFWIESTRKNSFQDNSLYLRAQSLVSATDLPSLKLLKVVKINLPSLQAAYPLYNPDPDEVTISFGALNVGHETLSNFENLEGLYSAEFTKHEYLWSGFRKVIEDSYEKFGIRPLKYLTYCHNHRVTESFQITFRKAGSCAHKHLVRHNEFKLILPREKSSLRHVRNGE